MEKATQMWEDAAKDEEGGKGDDASNEGQRGTPTTLSSFVIAELDQSSCWIR